jgi:hypothetical protein
MLRLNEGYWVQTQHFWGSIWFQYGWKWQKVLVWLFVQFGQYIEKKNYISMLLGIYHGQYKKEKP